MVTTCAIHMTIEQFRAEYHLLDRVCDGTVETHHAQAAAGVMVMVHFLRGTESQNATILGRIERLETGRRQKVLRIVDVDGVTAVVTRFILDLTSFEEWLGVEAEPADPAPPGTPPAEGSVMSEASATLRAPPAGSPAPERADATPRRSEPGDFTVAFRAPSPPTDPAAAVPPAPSETSEPEPEPDRPVASPEQRRSADPHESESAEFGRLFAVPGRPQPTPRPSAPAPGTAKPQPPAEPAPPTAASPPPTPPAGARTRPTEPTPSPTAEPPPPVAPARPVVSTPSPLDPPPPAAPTPPPTAEPPPVAPPPRAEPPPGASPPPSPPFQPPGRPMPEVGSLRKSKPREPGGYTRLVKPQPMPEPPPRGDGPPAFPGPGAEQVAGPPETDGRLRYGKDSFRERLAAPSPDASPSPPPPAAPLPPPPAAPTGPGEYTKVIESMPTPNLRAPQPSPSPAPPPPPPKPPAASSKRLVFALLGVLLAAILFVVIFTILT